MYQKYYYLPIKGPCIQPVTYIEKEALQRAMDF